MRISTLGLALMWAALVSAGCARPEAAGRGPEASDSTMRAAATGRQAPAAVMLGRWALSREAPPRDTPGLRITLRVDSARGDAFFGRLTSMFSGNVGIDPAQFQPFHGVLSDAAGVTLEIARSESAEPGLVFQGTLREDTVRLDVFVVGRDTLSHIVPGWQLLRQR